MSFLSGIFSNLLQDHNFSENFVFSFLGEGPGGISSLSSQLMFFDIGESLANQNGFYFPDTNLDDLPVEQPITNGPITREYHPSDTVPDVIDLPPSHNIQLHHWIDQHGHYTMDV